MRKGVKREEHVALIKNIKRKNINTILHII